MLQCSLLVASASTSLALVRFEEFIAIKAEPHLNTCFKHFIFFVLEFDLMSEKEYEPLKELIASFIARAEHAAEAGTGGSGGGGSG